MTTLPNFDTATFEPGALIDNLYYPLTPGTISVYEGEKEDEETSEEIEEVNRTAVTFETRDVAGVAATVVRDTAWANGFLQEDTRDWFAQDTDGNVWYLGENSLSYDYDDNGNFIGTSSRGSWEAGVNGALPGYIMEANPQVGDRYYQEFAPNNQAVDQAEVISQNQAFATELGNFSNVLQTFESTTLEPGVTEFKYYAPGVGLVGIDEGLNENLEPEFTIELESVTTVTPDFFTSGQGTVENDALDGNNESNILRGRQGDDLLQSFDGDDWLIGGKGKDFLIGGNGVDVLQGGRGQDILIGGEGMDILDGGKNRDQFVFRTLEDKGDLILDFTSQDAVILVEIFNLEKYGSSNPFEDYLQLGQVGDHTVVRIDADGDAGSNPFEVLAILQNTNASSLSATNFVV